MMCACYRLFNIYTELPYHGIYTSIVINRKDNCTPFNSFEDNRKSLVHHTTQYFVMYSFGRVLIRSFAEFELFFGHRTELAVCSSQIRGHCWHNLIKENKFLFDCVEVTRWRFEILHACFCRMPKRLS